MGWLTDMAKLIGHKDPRSMKQAAGEEEELGLDKPKAEPTAVATPAATPSSTPSSTPVTSSAPHKSLTISIGMGHNEDDEEEQSPKMGSKQTARMGPTART